MTRVLSARAEIAERTRAAHEALHHHPVISRLLADDLATAEYMGILQVFCDVYVAAEDRRLALGVWPDLSLARQCAALCADTHTPMSGRVPALDAITSGEEALGMLYALHGAQFGGALIVKHLRSSLPNAPMAYYSLRPDPRRWRDLIAQLDRTCRCADLTNRVVRGAMHIFELIGTRASEAGTLGALAAPEQSAAWASPQSSICK